ncbi:hypothetical protein [Bordetella sp. N]|uniref:hypothetical protein n=1 Tax=Bordetella sp. N TaxID=1746199 RepID=UPI0012E390D2|nr:hypothetical protein [Bordetella sp. N]
MSAAPSQQDSSAARHQAAAAVPPAVVSGEQPRHGSWLMASAWQRMGAALVVCVVLWALTGWAMGWW